MDNILLTYVLLQFLTVITQTTLKLLMIKVKNKHINAVANAIGFVIYNSAVYYCTKSTLNVILITTFISNVIGVEIVYYIINKILDNKKFEAVLIKATILDNIIPLIPHSTIIKADNATILEIYPKNKEEKENAVATLKGLNAKFTILKSA